jgi:hypothetical protein
MRPATLIFAAALLWASTASAIFAADDTPLAPPTTCGSGIPGGVNCIVSKEDKKEAHRAYDRGLKLQKERETEAAFEQFDQASRLVPQDSHFLAARELVKAQIVSSHIERGNAFLVENSLKQAANEYRAALDLDPDNQFARQQLDQSVLAAAPSLRRTEPARLENAGEVHIEPRNERATFHFTGDVRTLFNQIGAAFGVSVQFDDAVQARNVLFNVDDVDFFTAMKLAGEISKTMWTALDTHELFITIDNQENHKQYDRMSLGTLVLPSHADPKDATELITLMRTMFDIRFITQSQNFDKVEIRAPRAVLDACQQILEQFSNPRPQVMLDVSVFQISHQFTRDIGMHVPNTFNLFNIPAAALLGLGGQNIQQLINQLISSGGINQAGSTALSGLLAQLGGQSGGIFSQPLATFGGGLTFSGLSLDHLTAALSVNESWARSLEHVTMRATQGQKTDLHIGERYPIQNASFAPIFNSPQIAQVIGNQSFVPPFPSISYEDIGLNLKATPWMHGDNSVTLQLEMQVRSLTGASSNGVPVISNKEFSGFINVEDGESTVVAGEIDRTDQMSISGLPAVGLLSGLGLLSADHTKEENDDELMIVITPHIISDINRNTPSIFVSSK